MNNSKILFTKAKTFIPGGVNSPVRAFNGVGQTPIFIDHADGAYLFDVDGKKYVDYVLSWGPMVLGHNNSKIRQAVIDTASKGLSFGAPCSLEVELAEMICKLIPALDQVRMVNSGTEATMSAIRLARGYTGRDKIIKFEGCYHGHADSLLVKAGSGALTLGNPSSPGVPKSLAEHTLTCDYNDANSVENMVKQYPNEIAAIIVEPVAGNMNCVLPKDNFLAKLRKICDENGILLIIDEVMTGFRVALKGAQDYFGVTPDLCCFGKIIGGGMPVGAFGGKFEIMQKIAPAGPVYQAGTLSGNPVAMAAGIACLSQLTPEIYLDLTEKTTALCEGLKQRAAKHNINLVTNNLGGMFGFYFTELAEVNSFKDVMKSDVERFKKFFHLILQQGINLAPSAFEAAFMSTAHSWQDIEYTLECAENAFKQL